MLTLPKTKQVKEPILKSSLISMSEVMTSQEYVKKRNWKKVKEKKKKKNDQKKKENAYICVVSGGWRR